MTIKVATGESYRLAEIYPPPLIPSERLRQRVPLQRGDLSLGFGWWDWIGGSMWCVIRGYRMKLSSIS